MGYCTADDVCSAFPSFQRNIAGDIQDSEIDDWIDEAAAQIAAALVQRGFDPDSPPTALTTRQNNLLKLWNKAAVVARMAAAQAERSGAASKFPDPDQVMQNITDSIMKRNFDGIFGIASQFGGFAGGEIPDTETLDDEGLSNFFGKFEVNQK